MDVTTEQIAPRIHAVVVDLFPNFQGSLSNSLRIKDDLGADSMSMISLMIALDAEFDVEFDPAMLPSSSLTIGWIENFIVTKLNQDKPT